VGYVKALVFPAGEPVQMRMAARESGSFTLHVFLPGAGAPARFGPFDIHPEDDVAMVLEKGEVALHPSRMSCDND
jgi:hypothetical protein